MKHALYIFGVCRHGGGTGDANLKGVGTNNKVSECIIDGNELAMEPIVIGSNCANYGLIRVDYKAKSCHG